MTGRVDADGEELPSALLTEHLRFSLPYRSLFSHGLSQDNLPSLVDAMVVLLVRLHLADFFWGDVSLSNVLFRRSAGGFAAYLVDAETGELRPSLSAVDAGVRPHDRDRERLRRAARPAGQRVAELRGRGARDRRAARDALPGAVGRADGRGGVLGLGDVADRAAHRAAQRPRLRRRRARHRHRLRRRPGPDPAQGRRGRPPPARAAGADRAARRGRAGPAAAQRPRVVHRRAQPRPRGPRTSSRTAGSTRSTSRSPR